MSADTEMSLRFCLVFTKYTVFGSRLNDIFEKNAVGFIFTRIWSEVVGRGRKWSEEVGSGRCQPRQHHRGSEGWHREKEPFIRWNVAVASHMTTSAVVVIVIILILLQKWPRCQPLRRQRYLVE